MRVTTTEFCKPSLRNDTIVSDTAVAVIARITVILLQLLIRTW